LFNFTLVTKAYIQTGKAKAMMLIDKNSFELVFKEYYTPLCRKAYRLVLDKSVSEDIVQEVFLNLWNNKNLSLNPETLKAYLYRATINTAINKIKQSSRWHSLSIENLGEESGYELVAHHSGIEGQLEYKEMDAKIHELISSLPLGYRTMFLLSRFEDMTYAEIAQQTNTSVKTVENQISKALKILREGMR
jgi:RNA polymerase sigma-70 factor (ECF subfamily)